MPLTAPKPFIRPSNWDWSLLDLEKQILERQLTTGWNSPWTSSAGRLFDAVAAALNICRKRTYEGQPALELEMAAAELEDGYYSLTLVHDNDLMIVDTISLFRQVVEDYFKGNTGGPGGGPVPRIPGAGL